MTLQKLILDEMVAKDVKTTADCDAVINAWKAPHDKASAMYAAYQRDLRYLINTVANTCMCGKDVAASALSNLLWDSEDIPIEFSPRSVNFETFCVAFENLLGVARAYMPILYDVGGFLCSFI